MREARWSRRTSIKKSHPVSYFERDQTPFSNQSFHRLSAGVLAGALLACYGCGGSGAPPVSSSTEEATVHGRVTLDGKPPSGGSVSFDPSNIGRKDARIASAEIGKDGSYTIKTLVGENKVSVDSPETKKAMYSIDSFVVTSGENTHDIALTNQ